MEHYGTYFDRRYLSRGLALYRSMVRHCRPFSLSILCLDEFTGLVLSKMDLPEVHLVTLQELESSDPGLLAVRENRSRVEYYFTLTPSFLLHLVDRVPGLKRITYLDADLSFFSSPSAIFDELGEGSILIVGHRFPETLKPLEVYGIYNVGLLTFRGNPEGRLCLGWWRDRCLEWCYDRPEGGKFADQKYLDDWPDRFGAVVLENPGAGLAPWNQFQYRIRLAGGKVMVDGEPLVFYHFQGLRRANRWCYVLGMAEYGRPSRLLRRAVYLGIIREIEGLEKRISRVARERSIPGDSGDLRKERIPFRSLLRRCVHRDLALSVGRWAL